ncbi:MAG: IS21 family transposase [Synergistaceae bacterium]|nr:IS21 family transposase [Synergistota bacterium]NLM71858.1 IS21 family transposase [Synergistaceae bacterium]
MKTQYREILRLASLGLSGRSIAGSVSCSRNTVAEVLARAARMGLAWPLQPEVEEGDLRRLLFPEKEKERSPRTPDCEAIHRELAKPSVTLTLLWDNYCRSCREEGEIPYQYAQFCKIYRKYAVASRATMHIDRKPGERMEVDWAGKGMKLRDPATGEESPARLFVAVLPASQYAYVEAFPDMGMESWILGHVNAFAHFGGVPRMVVPDNLKTGVDRADWYSPVINRTYHEMAEHYGTAIVPARVRRPKDKASVEGTVRHISTWIAAALRNRPFFDFDELNREIRKKLDELNARPFQKRPGSRLSAFLEEERDYLFPLPLNPYEISVWKTATVAFNYHVEVDKNYYSVCHEYIKQKVDVRVTSRMVEIFYNGVRICSHPRITGAPGQYRTVPEHMPEKHRKTAEWNAERFVSWASGIGPNAEAVVRSLLAGCKVEEQGYRACTGILRMADKHSVERLENACARALSYTPRPTVRNISAILKSGQDKAPPSVETARKPDESHSFIRGAGYYGGRRDA